MDKPKYCDMRDIKLVNVQRTDGLTTLTELAVDSQDMLSTEIGEQDLIWPDLRQPPADATQRDSQ